MQLKGPAMRKTNEFLFQRQAIRTLVSRSDSPRTTARASTSTMAGAPGWRTPTEPTTPASGAKAPRLPPPSPPCPETDTAAARARTMKRILERRVCRRKERATIDFEIRTRKTPRILCSSKSHVFPSWERPRYLTFAPVQLPSLPRASKLLLHSGTARYEFESQFEGTQKVAVDRRSFGEGAVSRIRPAQSDCSASRSVEKIATRESQILIPGLFSSSTSLANCSRLREDAAPPRRRTGVGRHAEGELGYRIARGWGDLAHSDPGSWTMRNVRLVRTQGILWDGAAVSRQRIGEKGENASFFNSPPPRLSRPGEHALTRMWAATRSQVPLDPRGGLRARFPHHDLLLSRPAGRPLLLPRPSGTPHRNLSRLPIQLPTLLLLVHLLAGSIPLHRRHRYAIHHERRQDEGGSQERRC